MLGQHVEEGAFNSSYNSRKYGSEDCGKVPSFGSKGKKVVDCVAQSTPVNAAASGRLSEW